LDKDKRKKLGKEGTQARERVEGNGTHLGKGGRNLTEAEKGAISSATPISSETLGYLEKKIRVNQTSKEGKVKRKKKNRARIKEEKLPAIKKR